MALATGVFFKAIHQRANFYAACVYLSQSSANLMVSLRAPLRPMLGSPAATLSMEPD